MKKTEVTIVGFVFILLGFLTVIHHLLISGRLFDLGDIFYHEFFEAILFTAGIVLLLTARFNRK